MSRGKTTTGNTLRLKHVSEYGALKNAIHRCENKKHQYYDNYGGRGIRVADEFKGKDGFKNFLAEVGPKPAPGYTLERLDNSKGYVPGNLGWASRKEQALNRRTYRPARDLGWGFGYRTSIRRDGRPQTSISPLIEFDGKTQTLAGWADELGIDNATLRQRLYKGWSLEKALTSQLFAPSRHGAVARMADRVKPSSEVVQDAIDLLDTSITAISRRVH